MADVVAAAPMVLMDEATRLRNSTVARVVAASDGKTLDDAARKACVEALQKVNGELKKRIADGDALACHEAMKGGIKGFFGCDNNKLINTLCTRTKSALERTRVSYRAKYDKDLAVEVKSETSSDYGKMMAS